MFIKLHKITGKCQYINMDNVTMFEKSNDFTRVFEINSNEYLAIKETPEQIVTILEATKEVARADLSETIQIALDNNVIAVRKCS
jgi:hypothetical protein